MGNPISNWLSQFADNAGAAAGSINPLTALFQNYQMQGAERDVNNAGNKANEFADFLKTQINRNVGTADELAKALAAAFGPNSSSAAADKMLPGLTSSANNGQAGIDALTALGNKREGWMAEDRAKLDGVMTGAGDRLDSLYDSLGKAKMYGEADVNNLTSDIYNKKVGAVDRSVKLASSQGFADALTRGLSDSSQAADSRDNVARRFADTYSGLDADSRAQATQQVGQLSDLQSKQRGSAISELTNVINPELQARVATYRPDTTAQFAATAEADFGREDLERLGRVRSSLVGENNAKTATLVAGLNGANAQATNAASALATNSSAAYAEALKSLGANRNAMANTIAPVGGLLSGVAKDALPALIKSLPVGLASVGTVLTNWLGSGGQEVTPEVAQAIEQAYASWGQQDISVDEIFGGDPLGGLDVSLGDWSMDDWFSGWGGGLVEEGQP